MTKTNKTEDETLKFFQKMNDENWVSDTELFERGYELNKNKENCIVLDTKWKNLKYISQAQKI